MILFSSLLQRLKLLSSPTVPYIGSEGWAQHILTLLAWLFTTQSIDKILIFPTCPPPIHDSSPPILHSTIQLPVVPTISLLRSLDHATVFGGPSMDPADITLMLFLSVSSSPSSTALSCQILSIPSLPTDATTLLDPAADMSLTGPAWASLTTFIKAPLAPHFTGFLTPMSSSSSSSTTGFGIPKGSSSSSLFSSIVLKTKMDPLSVPQRVLEEGAISFGMSAMLSRTVVAQLTSCIFALVPKLAAFESSFHFPSL
mmetsp:Transcript_10135/g.20738  ORF Transcript_10135/g.20738 Transcript_10135/m.20738 type:complete len:256 (+) Transcript_10135:917-1684(+)